MSTVRIESPGTPGMVVEVYANGSGGQGGQQVETRVLTPAVGAVDFDLGPAGYLLVRVATEDEAKTIDNWSQTPPPGDQG